VRCLDPSQFGRINRITVWRGFSLFDACHGLSGKEIADFTDQDFMFVPDALDELRTVLGSAIMLRAPAPA
jgi:hypothetical protein